MVCCQEFSFCLLVLTILYVLWRSSILFRSRLAVQTVVMFGGDLLSLQIPSHRFSSGLVRHFTAAGGLLRLLFGIHLCELITNCCVQSSHASS
jgi:hypothetical protein